MKPILLAAAAFAAALVVASVHAADPERGQRLYERSCVGCHSLDANRIGPMHRGVYGRKAGSVPDFSYSPAVRNSAVIWEEGTLTRWLTNPEDVIPGQEMNFRVSLAEDRADIIAYLKQESGR